MDSGPECRINMRKKLTHLTMWLVKKLSIWLFNSLSDSSIILPMLTIQQMIDGQGVYSVDQNETVQSACQRMAEHQIGALVVLDGGEVVGIFTERDVVTRVLAKGLDVAQTLVGHVMSPNLVVISPTETRAACLEKMQRAHCRHLPVVANGQVMGMVSLRDLIQWELNEKREELEFLHAYISH